MRQIMESEFKRVILQALEDKYNLSIPPITGIGQNNIKYVG